MRRLKKRTPDEGIDISPLIDVVFILLIFFMVSTTFVKDAKVDIQRPSASSSTQASTQAPRIYVDAKGNFFAGEMPVKPWLLQSRVREMLQSSGELSVLVVADRRVRAEKLIEAVDQCRLAGASDVGVITQSEAG